MIVRYSFAAALLSLALAAPLAAAEGRYVVCDNGLRCLKAPCPSSIVRDLVTGKTFRSVSPLLDGLAEAARERIRQTDALYFGRLVLRGHVGRREGLPVLAVTGIGRATTPGERRGCPAG